MTFLRHRQSNPPAAERAEATYFVSPMDAAAIREWGRNRLTRAGGRVPQPGSPEWVALPDDHPAKVAAVIFGAIFYAEYFSVEAQLERAEVEEYLDRSAAKQAALVMSAMWQDRSKNQETFAELRRRRAVVPPLREIDPEAVARWVATGSSEPAPRKRAA